MQMYSSAPLLGQEICDLKVLEHFQVGWSLVICSQPVVIVVLYVQIDKMILQISDKLPLATALMPSGVNTTVL